MKAYNTTKYPVFEADQVLSQKHLNGIVSYLDEQDRLTRTGLIGLGIVCGLEVSYPSSNQIKINCGTAVTSLGFQINWEEKLFTHFHTIELSKNFLEPEYLDELYLDPIFKHASKYQPIKNTIELLESSSTEVDKVAIPNNFFANKTIMLLLETSLIDQKNCVSTNCDDKGKRLEFKVRPLVIDSFVYQTLLFPEFPKINSFKKLVLPRYNVPFTNIINGNQVLNGFKKIFTDASITAISNQISEAYSGYNSVLINNPDFAILANSKAQILQTITLNQDSLNVQYIWDWLFDIANAYNEIVDFKNQNPSFCCTDENLFPFHVIVDDTIVNNNSRTPFIKTGNSDNEKNQLKKINLLFARLAHIINHWKIQDTVIRITPSIYGDVDLSKKSIPFYYDQFLALKEKWNPEKTLRAKTNEILSYQSDKTNYTDLQNVKIPLLFDIEPYNFFRIEGHAGKNYQTALTEIISIKETYNLPFKVIALNAADFVGKQVDITKHTGDWGDLEVDYDLARKKVYNITEFVIKWITLNKTTIIAESLFTDATIVSLTSILNEVKLLLKDDLSAFLPHYKNFYEIFKNLNVLFLFHRFCITFTRPNLSKLAEDLIDHLDEINELFLEDPFTVIFDEAQKRWEVYYKEMFFSSFLKKNKGIEHKAGVTKDGTFILVYTDSTIFKPQTAIPQQTALLNSIISYNNSFDFGENTTSIKEGIIGSVVLTRSNFDTALPYDPTALTDCRNHTENIKTNLINLASYNLAANYPAHIKDFFLSNISSLLQYETTDTTDGTINQKVVLADFYLPYICCSDGNNINIVIGEEPVVPGDFSKTDFNNDDFNN
jgi:hypothetical protein